MAIYTPGKRDRHGRMGGSKRSVVALLSLTAMVDLFTVLVVFLLQNYATTGEVIDIPEGVELPSAQEVKDLKPANVVIVTDKEVRLNNDVVMPVAAVRASEDWMLEPLRASLEKVIQKGEEDSRSIRSTLKNAVEKIKTDGTEKEDDVAQFRKITIQADKELDFLTLKKVMYTATEAGAFEINFAVMKNPDEVGSSN